MSRQLTNLRMMATTVFVDHFLDHVYVCLMKGLMLSKKLLAKHSYKHFLSLLGVESKAYHVDNGVFQIKVSEMIVLFVISQLLPVELEVIIKME